MTLEILRNLLSYNPKTGEFTWLSRRGYTITENSKAGHTTLDGYISITVLGQKYLAHRLAWLWMTGLFPEKFIDHIDGDKTNNCWNNLRLADRCQNATNCKLSKKNTSGITGVSYRKDRGHWRAYVSRDTVQIPLGSYDNFDDAVMARYEGELKYYGGFNKNSSAYKYLKGKHYDI